MSRSRRNGKTGDIVDLYAFFYKNGELTEPSSIGAVDIIKQGEVIDTVAASDIVSYGNGIKRISYDIPNSWEKNIYTDKWNNIVYDSGVASDSKVFEFVINVSEWDATPDFSVYLPSLYAKTEFTSLKLGEKKWIRFSITDGAGYINNTDKVTLIMKDHVGSNVYIYDSCVNEGLSAYYFMNTSSLREDYPEYIDRTNSYDFVLRVEYRDELYVLDPIEFNFSEDT